MKSIKMECLLVAVITVITLVVSSVTLLKRQAREEFLNTHNFFCDYNADEVIESDDITMFEDGFISYRNKDGIIVKCDSYTIEKK